MNLTEFCIYFRDRFSLDESEFKEFQTETVANLNKYISVLNELLPNRDEPMFIEARQRLQNRRFFEVRLNLKPVSRQIEVVEIIQLTLEQYKASVQKAKNNC